MPRHCRSSSETDNPDSAAPIANPVQVSRPKTTLKEYIERLDKKTLQETSHFASLEATQMVQGHAVAGVLKSAFDGEFVGGNKTRNSK